MRSRRHAVDSSRVLSELLVILRAVDWFSGSYACAGCPRCRSVSCARVSRVPALWMTCDRVGRRARRVGTGRIVWACLAGLAESGVWGQTPSGRRARAGLARGARGAAAGRLSASEDKKLAVSVIQCGRFYPVPYGVTGHTSHTTHRSSDLGRAARAEGPRGMRQTHRSGSRLNLDGRRG